MKQNTSIQPTELEEATKWWFELTITDRNNLLLKYNQGSDLYNWKLIEVWKSETQKSEPTDREKAEKWFYDMTPIERQNMTERHIGRGINWDNLTYQEIILLWERENEYSETQPEQEREVSGEGIMEKQVREAYIHFRKTDNTVPDDVLDFMKDAALSHKLLYNALKDIVDYEMRCRERSQPMISEKWFNAAKKALQSANKNFKP